LYGSGSKLAEGERPHSVGTRHCSTQNARSIPDIHPLAWTTAMWSRFRGSLLPPLTGPGLCDRKADARGQLLAVWSDCSTQCARTAVHGRFCAVTVRWL